MIRFLTLTAFTIAVIALSQATLHAQDADLPVAAADEIIILGEVLDAAPGTDVWAFYLVLGGGSAPCGQTTTDERSRFVLVVDAGCATPLGPSVCWGELPDWKQGPEELCDSTLSPAWFGDSPGPGETVEMGLLVRTLVPGTPDLVPDEPADDRATEVEKPAAAPDEIIFIGEAPAPPGTEISAQYIQIRAGSGQVVACGTTTSGEESRFLLVVDAGCADESIGPLICWGPLGSNSCQGLSSEPFVIVPRDGRTFDVGLLAPHERSSPVTIMPSVGSGQSPERDIPFVWLAIALLLTAALGAGAGSYALRRLR